MVVWTLSSLFQHFYTSRGWDLVADQETILKRTPGEGWYRPGLAAEYGANLTSLVETARQTFPRAKICVQYKIRKYVLFGYANITRFEKWPSFGPRSRV
eukprot:1193888-Prorocentrum_minimum.AAC.2